MGTKQVFNIFGVYGMLIPLLFCLLPRLGLSNLLHTGCRVQNFLKFSTFKDSVSFHMFLPSTLPSKVVVEQGNKTTSLLVNDTMGSEFSQRWEKVRLEMRGQLRLIRNGKMWVESNDSVTQEPLKTVRVGPAILLENCPQGLPNWKLARSIQEVEQVLRRGTQETFSLMSPAPVSPSFSVGNTSFIMCWDKQTSRPVLTRMNGLLHPVPASHWVNLLFNLNEWDFTLEIQDPVDKKYLIKIPSPNKNQIIKFHTYGLTNNLYVVQHLEGLPSYTSTTSDKTDICLWVAVPVICVLLVLLLVMSCLFVFLHLCRMGNRKVVQVLRENPPVLSQTVSDNEGYLEPRQDN